MIEQGIPDGIPQCSTRHTLANVPGTDTFNPQQEPSQILDLDVNGLYPSTMRESLPVANFEWMTDDEISCSKIEEVPDDAPTGYILEADLKYPHDLHDTHSDFPLGNKAFHTSGYRTTRRNWFKHLKCRKRNPVRSYYKRRMTKPNTFCTTGTWNYTFN